MKTSKRQNTKKDNLESKQMTSTKRCWTNSKQVKNTTKKTKLYLIPSTKEYLSNKMITESVDSAVKKRQYFYLFNAVIDSKEA